MLPPVGAVDHAFRLDDAVDIPVLVRRDGRFRRPREREWRGAAEAWPSKQNLPPDGWYLANTTWRQIIQAATSVGRDLTPWLRSTPSLAVNEYIARVAPLQAYLGIKQLPKGRRDEGRRLFVSAVYERGTERSAHSAFGYHLGMTMAQWMSVGLCGLGPTRHIEAGGPGGHPGFLAPGARLPDLWGVHPANGQPWLIEAKAARALGRSDLSKGQVQLDGGSSLMGVAHRQLLCGTSLPTHPQWEKHYLFMTVDTARVTPPGSPIGHLRRAPAGWPYLTEGSRGIEPEAIYAMARAQLLAYQALAYGSVQDLRIVPVAKYPYPQARVRQGAFLPLETHRRTWELRRRLDQDQLEPDEVVARSASAVDFVAARIPGTGVHVGLSHRLFAACAELHRVYVEWPDLTRSPDFGAGRRGFGDGGGHGESLGQAVREVFGMWEDEYRFSTGRRVWERFESGSRITWSELLPGRQMRVALDDPRGSDLLEAVDGETYLAIERNDPALFNAIQ